jgi:hypothetical protein
MLNVIVPAGLSFNRIPALALGWSAQHSPPVVCYGKNFSQRTIKVTGWSRRDSKVVTARLAHGIST